MPTSRNRPRGFETLEGRALLSGGLRPSSHGPSLVSAESTGAKHGRFLKNLSYPSADGRSRSLDVILPAGREPSGGWPVILAIHGGGWRRFNKEEYEPMVDPLARSGFAIVAIDYTLSAPGSASATAAIQDVRSALAWVRNIGPGLGLDPDRVAAMGESAGGHLAALLGTDPGPSNAPLSAVVDFFGPTDLVALDAQGALAQPDVEQFLGGSSAQLPAAYADDSPVDHVATGDPPFLIVHGSADPIVPEAQSIELASDLTAARVPNQLIIVPGAGHGFGLHPRGMNLQASVVAFLDEAFHQA